MRKLLTTTSIALLLAGPTLADTSASATAETEANAGAQAEGEMKTEMHASVHAPVAGDYYGTDLIGHRILVPEADAENASDDAQAKMDDIGEIGDLLISKDGQVKAVLLDVGGFLGIGEKVVAVEMSNLKFVSDGENADEYRIVYIGDKMLLEDTEPFARETEAAETEMEQTAEAVETEAEQTAEAVETEAEQTAEAVEAEAEQTAEAVETEAEQTTEAAETEAEQTAEAAEAEAEQKAEAAEAEVEGEKPEMAARWDAPLMERDGYDQVKVDVLTADDLQGVRVYSANDEDIGEIHELLLTEDGKIDQALIDVGGFLGIGEKRVAVSFDELQLLRNGEADLRVYVGATQEQLEQRAEHDG